MLKLDINLDQSELILHERSKSCTASFSERSTSEKVQPAVNIREGRACPAGWIVLGNGPCESLACVSEE